MYKAFNPLWLKILYKNHRCVHLWNSRMGATFEFKEKVEVEKQRKELWRLCRMALMAFANGRQGPRGRFSILTAPWGARPSPIHSINPPLSSYPTSSPARRARYSYLYSPSPFLSGALNGLIMVLPVLHKPRKRRKQVRSVLYLPLILFCLNT